MAGVYTHAFDFYYKIAPTASGVLDSPLWVTESYFNDFAENNTEYWRGWYNLYPVDTYWPSYPSLITRDKPQLNGSVYNNGALAWGSIANDLLWNVLTPSMSYTQNVSYPLFDTRYRATYTSKSLLYTEWDAPGKGVASYPITSSWIAYEPNLYTNASMSANGYVIRGTGTSFFPASINTTTAVYALPTSASYPTTTYPTVGQNPSNIVYGNNSTGSNDGRFFDLAGGCGINRTSISASLVAFNKSASFTTTAARDFCTAELKKRRLFFPTIRTGSMSFTAGAPGAWVQKLMGKPSNEFFTENGGIYNVKFTLKRDITNGFYPDEGGSSQLLVYIHNVNSIIPAPSGRVPGANGWYPPDNNIIRIKNSPAMSFVNPATGYLIESFNINIIQYGAPAQLVFEASGSLDANQYFGCIIDDVEFCKIGVSTDPALIKPSTPGQFVTETQDQIR